MYLYNQKLIFVPQLFNVIKSGAVAENCIIYCF